jgi:hypothetical protein
VGEHIGQAHDPEADAAGPDCGLAERAFMSVGELGRNSRARIIAENASAQLSDVSLR